MKITRTTRDSRRGPVDWFTGEVWLDEIAGTAPPSRLAALNVHFSPGARTAWHRHPFGQVIHVTEGVGRVQREGGRIEEIRAGDTVRFDPDENHWHGAAPHRFMAHIAIQEVDHEGIAAYWGEQVSEADYLAEAASG